MLWTCHSHSGEFCTHATNTLTERVEDAIARGLTTICLTEHIPRHPNEYYPDEEKHALVQKHGDLFAVFDSYYRKAVELRESYQDRIQILIGFEGEWISDATLRTMEGLRRKHSFDLFLGSNHHVAGIPIDYTDEEYARARDSVGGGSEEALAAAFFDEQLLMLETLRPPIVAHFDLIRLKASDKDRDWREMPGIWEKIVRNLAFAKSIDAVLEVNTAALRKGLGDVYPRKEILEMWHGMGGRCTLSDDSHGCEHLCTNYARGIDCIQAAGIVELYHPHRAVVVGGESKVTWQKVASQDVRSSLEASG